MSIDFHSKDNQYSYSNRTVDQNWQNLIQSRIDVKGKRCVDIGCSSGIYSRKLVDLGAAQVTGIDFSEVMIEAAREKNQDIDQLSFRLGEACETGLDEGHAELILERALIHHLSDLDCCFKEAYRLLTDRGLLIVQDRTLEDFLLPGSQYHIRGYFLEAFPKLIDIEISQRHEKEVVEESLTRAGFGKIEVVHLWERRQIYPSIRELGQDILARKGRSILHQLNDQELERLVGYIRNEIGCVIEKDLIDVDRWTIWFAWKL